MSLSSSIADQEEDGENLLEIFADDPMQVAPPRNGKKRRHLQQGQSDEPGRKSYLIYPGDRVYFDLFISLLLVYSCNMVPLQMAFHEDMDLLGWNIVNWTIDGFFYLDIVLTFLTVVQLDD